MPGLLKTVGSNKDHPKPIKVSGLILYILSSITVPKFEVS